MNVDSMSKWGAYTVLGKLKLLLLLLASKMDLGQYKILWQMVVGAKWVIVTKSEIKYLRKYIREIPKSTTPKYIDLTIRNTTTFTKFLIQATHVPRNFSPVKIHEYINKLPP